jgi:hypothetical protein
MGKLIRKSSSETGDRDLAGHRKIPVERARKFLARIANASDDNLRIFEKSFGSLFMTDVPTGVVRQWMLNIEEADAANLSDEDVIRRYWLIPLRNAIRTVWSLPDLRSKQFAVHEILKQFLLRGDRRFCFTPLGESYSYAFLDSLGPPSHLERILEELTAERSHHLAHFCRNRNCPNPYFFAERADRKYCSEVCALPAQREAKLKWWNATGKRRRSELSAVQKRRRAQKSQRTAAGLGKME